jgi:hypothetical protein
MTAYIIKPTHSVTSFKQSPVLSSHLFMPFSISGVLSSRGTDIGKRALEYINLFIKYFNIELKRTKLTSHTNTKLMDMSDRHFICASCQLSILFV